MSWETRLQAAVAAEVQHQLRRCVEVAAEVHPSPLQLRRWPSQPPLELVAAEVHPSPLQLRRWPSHPPLHLHSHPRPPASRRQPKWRSSRRLLVQRRRLRLLQRRHSSRRRRRLLTNITSRMDRWSARLTRRRGPRLAQSLSLSRKKLPEVADARKRLAEVEQRMLLRLGCGPRR